MRSTLSLELVNKMHPENLNFLNERKFLLQNPGTQPKPQTKQAKKPSTLIFQTKGNYVQELCKAEKRVLTVTTE